MRRSLLLAVLILGNGAVAGGRIDPSGSAGIIDRVSDEYFDWLKGNDLMIQRELGITLGRLPDVSFQKAEQDRTRAEKMLSELTGLTDSDLDHERWLTLQILRWNLNALADAPRFHWLKSAVTPYSCPLNDIDDALAQFRFRDAADVDRYLDLVRQYAIIVHQLDGKLHEQRRRGIVVPRDELRLVESYLSSLVGDSQTSPVAVARSRLASLDPMTADRFSKELKRTIETQVNPALRDLLAYVGGDYAQAAPARVGLGQYPGGHEYYLWLVKHYTTLDVAPGQVHEIGLREADRISGEMEQTKQEVGFKGSLVEFRAALSKDPRFYARTPEEFGVRLHGYIERIRPRLAAYFERRPQSPFDIRRLRPELEGGQTFGYYDVATADHPIGVYWYNASDLGQRSMLGAGDLVYHEIIPGHHFEDTLRRESPKLDGFRRLADPDAYAEGWAEYASQLAGEMGMYADPYDRFGRLCGEMLMSIRMVVDTGMNDLGWSRQRAVDYMRAYSCLSERELETESLRYGADIPGQALAYHLPGMEFARLRDAAKKQLGTKFDIRDFHEGILGSGSMPLYVLQRHVDWWVRAER